MNTYLILFRQTNASACMMASLGENNSVAKKKREVGTDKKDLVKLLSQPGNDVCADCGAKGDAKISCVCSCIPTVVALQILSGLLTV